MPSRSGAFMCPACCCGTITAGPDGIRGSGSNHLSALVAPGPNGVSRSPVRPVGIKLFSPLQNVLRLPLVVSDPRILVILTVLILSHGSVWSSVCFSLGQQSPSDTCRLVGHGHCDQSRWTAFEQAVYPIRSGCGSGPCIAQHGGRTDDQKPTNVRVPLLRYPAQTVLAAGGVLPGNEPQPGREFTA